MKRLVSILLVAIALCVSVAAQESEEKKSERDETKWASINYYNVPIYKILEGKQAFVVYYGKHRRGASNTTIPKKWAKGNVNDPRKLKFRYVEGTLEPFMTVVTDDGNFKRVILNVPLSKANPVWGVAQESAVKDADKDTLEKLER